jgi:hypothetical protein
MELQLKNTPYNLFYKRSKDRIKSAYKELNNIHFDNEKGQNLKCIKRMIILLFPIVYHLGKIYFPAYLLCLIISFPVVLLVRLVRPIFHIRFGRVFADGFGQSVLIPEVYLSRKKAGFDE